MGRILKRVALDFEWPLRKIWSGYLNPHQKHKCNKCQGGWSEDYEKLEALWFGWHNEIYKPNTFNKNARYNRNAWEYNLDKDDIQALIDEDRLWEFTRVPLNEEHKKIVEQKVKDGGNNWLPFNNGYIPTPKEVNDWSLKGIGHDAINRVIVIKAKLAREGKSHLCSKCDGEAVVWQSEKARELYEGWTPYDPPSGEGYQLWENTSEGSPITPVFDSLDKLCQYCQDYNVSVLGNETASKEQWFKWLNK